MPELLAYADFTAGRVFELGTVAVELDEMLDFNCRYDPQRFHVDPVAAKQSLLGGLCASGWYTGALWMRLWVDEVVSRAAAEGSPGLSELRWPAPVFPGDLLTGRAEVLSARVSRSRPGLGLVGIRGTMSRGDVLVMTMESVVLFGGA